MKNYTASAQIKKALVVALFLGIMILAASCTVLSRSEDTEVSDCLWKATGSAWNDDNQNGVQDDNEKPLAGIKFWVDDTLNDHQKVNNELSDTVATDTDGNVEISVWLPGCPNVRFEVYTEAPQNCRLTTQERISVNLSSQDAVYSFGFVC
jgi:hypothetical protein